jgi:hypothetical protein
LVGRAHDIRIGITSARPGPTPTEGLQPRRLDTPCLTRPHPPASTSNSSPRAWSTCTVAPPSPPHHQAGLVNELVALLQAKTPRASQVAGALHGIGCCSKPPARTGCLQLMTWRRHCRSVTPCVSRGPSCSHRPVGPHQRWAVCQGHGDGDRPDQPRQLPQLKPFAGGRRPGGSSGTSIVEPSSIG